MCHLYSCQTTFLNFIYIAVALFTVKSLNLLHYYSFTERFQIFLIYRDILITPHSPTYFYIFFLKYRFTERFHFFFKFFLLSSLHNRFDERFFKISFFYKKAKTTTLCHFLSKRVFLVKHRINHFFYIIFIQKIPLVKHQDLSFFVFFLHFFQFFYNLSLLPIFREVSLTLLLPTHFTLL